MMQENLLVLQDGARYRALTEISRQSIAEAADAGVVVQSAVDALSGEGGMVTLGRGIFRLTTPLQLAASVWLRGSGRATRLRVATTYGILVEGNSGAVISDLALEAEAGATAGIVLDAAYDCAIHDAYCATFGGYGIWMRNNSALCRIRGCSLAANAIANLYLDDLRAGAYGEFVPNQVADCTIAGGGAGIVCRRALTVSINACVVHQARGAAYHIRERSHGVAISGSRAYQIAGDAIIVEGSREISLTNNVCCWHSGDGILVRDATWGVISGNEIVDSGDSSFDRALAPVTDARCGIRLTHVQGYQISGNTIANQASAPPLRFGVWEDEQSGANSIVGNSVNTYHEAAVRIAGAGTVESANQGVVTPLHRS